MEQQPADTAMLAQILLKQGEMGGDLKVISEQLKAVPDHETRIRALERFRFALVGGAAVASAAGTVLGYLLSHR